MVRAILDGRKTQTRRVMKPQPENFEPNPDENSVARVHVDGEYVGSGVVDDGACVHICPYGAPGERLWVRETWKPDPSFGYPAETKPRDMDSRTHVLYRATLATDHPKAIWQRWRPSIFMPRWASRITLEITDVRVERVQSISVMDAQAEGCNGGGQFYRAYRDLWDSINAKRGFSWESNPWVWVLGFRRVESEVTA